VSAIVEFVMLVMLNMFVRIRGFRLMVERVKVSDNINKAARVEYFLVNKDVAAPQGKVQWKISSLR